MTRFNIGALVVCFASVASLSQSARAQYMPQRPVISPWMGMWQRNTGPLDNYHTFVLPQMQLDRTLQMQNAALYRQQAGLQYLNNEIIQTQYNASAMMPTGQGATYMNYSHYYGGVRSTQASSAVSPRPAARRMAFSPSTAPPSVPHQ
jgi:hypothetical protein